MGEPYCRTGDGLWVATIEAGWTQRGTRRRLTVSARTERECKQKLRAKEREISRAGVPGENAAAATTVKSWSERWLPIHARNVRPAAYSADRSQVTHWIIPTIGHKRLMHLSPADVRAVRRAVLDAGLANSTATRAHAVLKKMLRDAAQEGYFVPANVLDTKGQEQKGGEKAREVIDAADAASLLTTAAREPGGARWVLALLEGLRPAEALGLTWECVNLEESTLSVEWQLKRLPYNVARDRSSGFRAPDGYAARRLHGAMHLVRPKTSSGIRRIPLVPAAVEALAKWRAVAPDSPHGLVFPGDGGRGRDDKADRAAWVALQDAAQVARVERTLGGRYDLYECRHTTATLLLAAGADNATIVAIMGHASILSTHAYLHTDMARAREVLIRATSHLLIQA